MIAPARGVDGVLASSVPPGSGLSSSAALEVAVALALGGGALAPVELALACQRAEHLATGVPSGVMDQLASVASRADRALLIDCRSLELRYVRIPDDAASSSFTRASRERWSEALQRASRGVRANRHCPRARLVTRCDPRPGLDSRSPGTSSLRTREWSNCRRARDRGHGTRRGAHAGEPREPSRRLPGLDAGAGPTRRTARVPQEHTVHA